MLEIHLEILKYHTTYGVNIKTHLEELHSYTGKHEIQQHGDQDDVADGLDGHKHTLDHVLSVKTNKTNGHLTL